MWLILVIILILVILGLPTWPYTRGWGVGYGPSGVLSVILVMVIVLLLLGKL